ncbi:hypothetical protein K439DRAFT_1632336 [Ramaria rubella]|nr:hypothetical protein K439DRAFT_1632336 [Ramaria rubella]
MSRSPSPSMSPEFNLGVILSTAQGWGDSYEEDMDARLTPFHSDTEEGVMRLLNTITSNPSFADRVRSLGVDFRRDTSFARSFAATLNDSLRMLPKLESITLEGCTDDFPVLKPPVRFPYLRNLTCDLPPSSQLIDFLRKNPTIDNFCYGGADMSGDILPESRLPKDVLPNLQYLQCDIWLLSYFVPGRPVFWVMPLNYPADDRNVFDPIALEEEIQSLEESVAGGGTSAGGGVKKFWLGCSYPFDKLYKAAPNIEHLHLEENIVISDGSDNGSRESDTAKARFWTLPAWEKGLELFEGLRKINIRFMGEITDEEQRQLVNRWSTASNRPKNLTRITFDYGFLHSQNPQRHPVEALVEFSDATSPPELVWNRASVLSDSDSDSTPSLSGTDEDDKENEDADSDSDLEVDGSSASSDESFYTAYRSRAKWVWNQGNDEWECVLVG